MLSSHSASLTVKNPEDRQGHCVLLYSPPSEVKIANVVDLVLNNNNNTKVVQLSLYVIPLLLLEKKSIIYHICRYFPAGQPAYCIYNGGNSHFSPVILSVSSPPTDHSYREQAFSHKKNADHFLVASFLGFTQDSL